MYLQVTMQENGRKDIFREMQTTNKVQLIFLDVKMFTERSQWRLWMLEIKKEGTVYVFSLKISSKKP